MLHTKMTNRLNFKTGCPLYEAFCAAFQAEVDPVAFILIGCIQEKLSS